MFEAYKIGVKISVINHASIGLMALSRDFLKTEADAAKLEARILSIKNQALKGGLMVGLGAFGLSLFKAPLEAAKEYETAYTRFKTLNLGDAINRQADQFAKGTNTFGTSSKQLMDTLRESYGMIGDMDLAKKITPTIASLNAANSMLFGDKVGKIDANATRSIMRFIDMRGQTNTPEEIMRGLNLAQRMVTGSGGAMKFTDLEQFAKRGGTAFKGMNDDGVMMMATMIQEMGGASAGTGLMSAYQNLVAGRTTKKAMAALQDLGLAQLGEVNHGTVGGKAYKTVQIQEMQDNKTLRENFPLWIMKNVIPAMEKKGITGLPEQAAVVNNLLSNRTGSNLGVGFATQFLQTLRDKKMVENAMGVDQTINAAQNTTQGKEIDLLAKKTNLYQQLGQTVLPLYVKGLELTLSALKGVTGWIERNAGLTKELVVAFAALSGGLLIRGSVLLLTAAFRGLGGALLMQSVGGMAGVMRGFSVVTGLVGRYLPMALGFLGRGVLLAGRVLMFTPIGRILGLIAMGAYWVYQSWSSIYPRILKVWEIIKAVFNLGMDWIKTKIDVVWQAIKPVVDQVAGVMRGVYSAVTGWISGIYQWVLNSPVGKFVSGAVNFAKDVGSSVAGAYNSAKSFASNAGKNADAALNSGYAWAQDVNKGHSPNGSPYIASANAQPVQVQTSINLDGRKVAEVVSKHQSKELNRPATGGSRFDPTIGVPPVGMNYAK